MKIKDPQNTYLYIYESLDLALCLSGDNTIWAVSALPEPILLNREGDICTIWFPQYGFAKVWIHKIDFGSTEDI